MRFLLYYLLGINLVTFIIYGIDKMKAIKNRRRVKESFLFTLVMLGGFAGAFLGMFSFHHKTRKFIFYLVNMIALIIWIIIGWWY